MKLVGLPASYFEKYPNEFYPEVKDKELALLVV